MTPHAAPASERTPAPAACWSCSGAVDKDGLFCVTCGALQPPLPADHFARFGLPAGFGLDVPALERRYFELQRRMHPDRFAARLPKEREYSQQHAANLNDAYQTLRAPVSRAEYLLALRGKPMRGSGQETVDDEEILVHAMEMREQLAEAASPADVEAILKTAAEQAKSVERDIAAAFAAGDLAAAGRGTLRLKYLHKFLDDARERRGRPKL
ncbi:MAG: Fe-S protein assembly co-chaperone HscB [Alphaproteobacteria bacterium]|nr:Fe-S protein assembly co-chaperone HscB [Alphaproteobacteria bacterium]